VHISNDPRDITTPRGSVSIGFILVLRREPADVVPDL
jgi:hypothetical protein